MIKTIDVHTNLIVYVDIDGVLFNINERVLKVLGIKQLSKKQREEVLADNGYMSTICSEERWDEIKDKEELWINPEIHPIGQKLLESLKQKFNQIYLLSSPSDIPIAACEKVKFSYKFGFANKYVLTPNKELLANTNTLLIDDNEAMVTKFKKAGGLSYHFPCFEKFEDNKVSFEECWLGILNTIAETQFLAGDAK